MASGYFYFYKVILKFNKPTYVAMRLLERSNVLMYEFHLDHIKLEYGYDSRLLFSNTDSLKYKIKTEDVYEHISKDEKMFNFSNYLGKLIYFVDDSNKLVIGDMKDETGGFAIEKLFGLKQKM